MLPKQQTTEQEIHAQMIHEIRQTYIEDYAIFLDKHELDSTPELASVYFNARMNKIEEAARKDILHWHYRILQGMTRDAYREGVRKIETLLKEN